MNLRFFNFSDRAKFSESIVARISFFAEISIRERGAFHIVLAGGETPKSVYSKLREIRTSWPDWRFWFGDERCLPKGGTDRNDTMARRSLLDFLPVAESQIYFIPAELGPVSASKEYSVFLKSVFIFDVSLLGIGEDGHTASLFPGRELGDSPDSPDVLAVLDAPKPPAERVSLSSNRLKQSRCVMFLAAGGTKKEIVERLKMGEEMPASGIFGLENTEIYYSET